MDLGVGEDDARARGIFDGILGLAVLASDAADGAGEVIALKGLDILDLECCNGVRNPTSETGWGGEELLSLARGREQRWQLKGQNSLSM